MSYKDSGFKTSSFHSDFGEDFASSAVDSVLPNYQKFPKGAATCSELTDLYCSSKANETFAEFVKQMTIIQKHTAAYMQAVDPKDYRAMVIALEGIPEISEIKEQLIKGFSAKKITDFYTSKMIIRKNI